MNTGFKRIAAGAVLAAAPVLIALGIRGRRPRR